VTEALSSGDDIQRTETDELLLSIFTDVGEPIRLTDVVNVVSDIRGVKDLPVVSLDANGSTLSLRHQIQSFASTFCSKCANP